MLEYVVMGLASMLAGINAGIAMHRTGSLLAQALTHPDPYEVHSLYQGATFLGMFCVMMPIMLLVMMAALTQTWALLTVIPGVIVGLLWRRKRPSS